MVYPHAVTGVLSTKRRDIIKRNMALLPLYSIMLGFIALLGYMALADKTTVANVKKAGGNAQLAVPYLFQHLFPSWFTGHRLLRHRDRRAGPGRDHGHRRGEPVHPQHLQGVLQAGRHPQPRDAGSRSGPRWWSSWARWLFAVELPRTFSINLQLLGGIWILQVFPIDRVRPVHPVVPPLGAAGRLAGREDLRHDRRLQGGHPHHVALGRVDRPRVRPHRLHRPVRAHPQRRDLGDPDPHRSRRPGSPRAPTRPSRSSTPPTRRRRPGPGSGRGRPAAATGAAGD